MAGRDQATRERVLKAAAHLFAMRGFKKVTIREICAAAHANVAAVNYHFRDKLGLYREVLEMAIAAMQQTTEDAKRAGCGRTPREQLRAYISVYLTRLLGQGASTWLHRLMARELADSTPALDAIVDRAVRPRMDYLCVLVGDIIHRPPSDEHVRECVASIHAQCVMALPNPITDRLRLGFSASGDIEQLTDHIATFSLGGIRAIGRIASD
jgi:TetR/AcrR family transcriptional regulator, regulator of cefoperazone and chloramphenicol sensitivity